VLIISNLLWILQLEVYAYLLGVRPRPALLACKGVVVNPTLFLGLWWKQLHVTDCSSHYQQTNQTNAWQATHALARVEM
jgi:hypothetical protein